MKKITGVSLLVLCLLFAGRTFAFDKQAAVNELYTKSGLEQQLGQFGPEVAAGF